MAAEDVGNLQHVVCLTEVSCQRYHVRVHSGLWPCDYCHDGQRRESEVTGAEGMVCMQGPNCRIATYRLVGDRTGASSAGYNI